MGISGADLVIACVGAGLRAFTKYARVEYGNGEEVPAEKFLAEVETVVLETILGKLSKTVGAKNGQTSLSGLDPAALRSAQAGGELPNVSTSAEQSALGKLLANWNAVMVGKVVVEDRRKGQQRFELGDERSAKK